MSDAAEGQTTSPPPADALTLRVLATPADTNISGDIFGGWVMAQVDIAGSIAARRRAGGRVVTAAVKDFHFRNPVLVGDLVSLYAEIKNIGRTSLSVHVRAFAERRANHSETVLVAEAVVTYVAVDDARTPREIRW
jgi:acyl-CoA thioesterase YciA